MKLLANYIGAYPHGQRRMLKQKGFSLVICTNKILGIDFIK